MRRSPRSAASRSPPTTGRSPRRTCWRAWAVPALLQHRDLGRVLVCDPFPATDRRAEPGGARRPAAARCGPGGLTGSLLSQIARGHATEPRQPAVPAHLPVLDGRTATSGSARRRINARSWPSRPSLGSRQA
ncbi:MAG: hypothetical protein MZU91_12950 [Desulfosudis oleivorans]|nr:hypothetical protein [Desulfosudis oleivorans]